MHDSIGYIFLIVKVVQLVQVEPVHPVPVHVAQNDANF